MKGLTVFFFFFFFFSDSYVDGLIFIKGKKNEFIPEELLFIDYMERL